MPQNSTLGISGGEPTLLKKPLFNFLTEIIDERPDLMFHILTNAQHFSKEDRRLLSDLSNNVLWEMMD